MPGHLVRGHRAAERYRLESELGRGEATWAWRAVDETLERQVAVRFYGAALDRVRLLERAGVAASLTHPRVVRVFDSGFDGGQFFVVTELLPGSLGWARLPLPGRDVVRIGVHVAEALDYAHRRGIAHGALRPGNVLLSEQGAKVADFGLAADALSRTGTKAPAADLVQLGRLLRTALSGTAGRPLPDEPRGVARVIDGLEAGEYPDARSALAALGALDQRVELPARRARRGALAAALGALLVLAALGVGLLGGRRPSGPEEVPPPRVAGPPLRIVSVDDFDPLGDGREGSSTAAKVADGDTRTFWSTERYRSNARFSGRKTGVGVILDLGTPRDVAAVRVHLAARGCSFELRRSASRDRSIDGWDTVASSVDAALVSSSTVRREGASRWWLLWITKLTRPVPGAGSAFACAVSEVELFG